MSKNSKMAFISDIHFGVRNNSEVYLDIMEKFFLNTLPKVLIDHDIRDLRILGDLVEYRNTINIRTLNSILKIFRWYAIEMPNVKIKILTGNHDIYYHNRLDINIIEILREFNNVEVIDKVTEETINGKSVITYPWLIDGSEADLKFKAVQESKTKYDLCLGHFEINGFEMQRGITCDEGVERGAFKNYKRVFTGHFHIRNTSKDGKITYLGCPYQMDWGDYGNDKGVHIFDVSTGETTFVPNEDSPKFIKITIDDIQQKRKLKIQQVRGNFARLVIEKKVNEAALIKVQAKLEAMGPIKFDVDNQYIEEFEGIVDNVELENISDPLSFMNEYVEAFEFDEEEEIDKKEVNKLMKELYAAAVKD